MSQPRATARARCLQTVPLSVSVISSKCRTLNQQQPPPSGAMNNDIPLSTRRVVDGGPSGDIKVRRQTLSLIHRRIQNGILEHADLPLYLKGGVRGRSYVQSAAAHCSGSTFLGEDVKSFFPSIREHHVKDVFQHFFRFSPIVSTTLAQLCTLDDRLPQGAHTSTYISNLVLFNVEPAVVAELRGMRFEYGRFIDDVNVSSRRRTTKLERQLAIELIQSMLRRKGFKPNREKQVLATRGSQMRVHGLNVTTDRPTIPRKERRAIRAAVHDLETTLAIKREAKELEQALRSAVGRVTRLRQFHPAEGQVLMHRIERAVEACK
jgi:hypothetical protein